MSSFASKLNRAAHAAALGGAVVASTEVALVLVTGHTLFLTVSEMGRFAFAAWVTATAVATLIAAVGAVVVHAARGFHDDPGLARRGGERRLAAIVGGLVSIVSAAPLVLLTSGRRVHGAPLRFVYVVAGAVAVGGLSAAITHTFSRVQRAPSSSKKTAFALGAFAFAIGLVLANAWMFKRRYPAFHWTLYAASLAWSSLGATLLESRRFHSPWPSRAMACTSLCSLLFAPFALASLRASPNASFVARERAPLTGPYLTVLSKVVPVGDSAVLGPSTSAPAREGASGTQARLDLQDRDVLLVTVDALRADRLRAYGGKGLTPHMDALAAEGVVFKRAYTPTPHTSYALGSLHTGKFLRPVMDLPSPSQDHPTIAELVRRYGYRTAAFYPPAVFFVDEERFRSLRRTAYGFEYRKEEFAWATHEVEQVKDYLAHAAPRHPVFIWVHFFEPHEPYTPPPQFRKGESMLARYDGEVATVDDAFGRLVEAFRHARGRESTVILTSDHGEEFGDHGGNYHGTTLYDEQARIPLVWSSPGSVRPAVVSNPVESIDIATTLLAALGIPLDARMRGDDLGPLLLGRTQASPSLAFAETGEQRMVTDGRVKVLCTKGERECLLYDLIRDPFERRNVASAHPQRVTALQQELGRFIGSVPRVEAMAVADGVGWPHALARAELGDTTVGPDLVPLLNSKRPEVRAAAAWALGAVRHVPSRAILVRLHENDPDASVRAAAAVAAFRLGEHHLLSEVRAAVHSGGDWTKQGGGPREAAARAALALAETGDASGEDVLIRLAGDEHADEGTRRRAVIALGALRSVHGVDVLGKLIEIPNTRFRIDAATSLGRIPSREARRILLLALGHEPYLPARAAEAWALVQQGEKRVLGLVRRYLGEATPIPDGVAILLSFGELQSASPRGVDVRRASVARRGSWACGKEGCTPQSNAAIELPRVPGSNRHQAIFRVFGTDDGDGIAVDSVVYPLRRGMQEFAVPFSPSGRKTRFALEASRGAPEVVAVAVVPTASPAGAPPSGGDAGKP